MEPKIKLTLRFGLEFQDLYSRNGLKKIDDCFLEDIQSHDIELYNQIIDLRQKIQKHQVVNVFADMLPGEESEFLLRMAKILDRFIYKLFGLEYEIQDRKKIDHIYSALHSCNKFFIQKKVAHLKLEAAPDLLPDQTAVLANHGLDFPWLKPRWFKDNRASTIDRTNILEFELQFAKIVEAAEKINEKKLLGALVAYAQWALYDHDGIAIHSGGILFKIPDKIDYNNLLPDLISNRCGKNHKPGSDKITEQNNGENIDEDSDKTEELLNYPERLWKNRYNFKLNDNSRNLPQSLKEIHYCLYCHNRSKDSCSKGMKQATGAYSANPLGIELSGCPLREKISEMHVLRRDGYLIGSVTIAALDNPMLVATGHRICNDCMKACIYQKQTPVNIPMVETQNIDDLLDLPWGFEIYSLITKWNPLSFINFLPQEESNKKILVVGMGPAGFTLAHYLLNQGVTVVGIDGLKIEPLPAEINGIKLDGSRCDFEPIYNVKSLFQDLDERVAYGFGGVMEYGITARWNKNYLTIVRLLLERREAFRMYGGVRFGSQITHANVHSFGFEHVALATGAGRPKLPHISDVLAKGAQTASDFLMSLQLSGVMHRNSIANQQIRLPIVVIGAGLTAFDAATESLTYYCAQVEKFLQRHEEIIKSGADPIANLSLEDNIIAQEFITHAKELRLYPERQRDLLLKWGGVKIMYRGKFNQSPAYRINHEEVDHALREGIAVIENAVPNGIEKDKFGACKSVYYAKDNRTKNIPARTIIYAIGTEPNTTIARENLGIWDIDENKYFKLMEGKDFQIQTNDLVDIHHSANQNKTNQGIGNQKIASSNIKKCSYSIFGDNHPKYFGSVVKAMASAKDGYMEIIDLINQKNDEANREEGNKTKNRQYYLEKGANKINNHEYSAEFFAKLDSALLAKVVSVHRLTPTVVELIINAPTAAQNFQPGQFFRLQNYISQFNDTGSCKSDASKTIEPLALTGASVDHASGNISLIVLEVGGSSKLCSLLQPGEYINLMGPTGSPTELPSDETIMLVGGGLGNAVLFSIANGLKQNGCKVIYFAGYRHLYDRYKHEMIEENADIVIWACDQGLLTKSRRQDFAIQGNIINAIEEYQTQSVDQQNKIQLKDVDRVIVIGSDSMMEAVTRYIFKNIFKSTSRVFKENIKVIASINSPMQCMMKEICAQCLQRQVDPQTGAEKFVYSCFNQDQDARTVDFECLKQRLKKNSLLEAQTNYWLGAREKLVELRENDSL